MHKVSGSRDELASHCSSFEEQLKKQTTANTWITFFTIVLIAQGKQ